MRILVLNHEFPPVGGGGGRASADLGAALVRRGHAVRVLTAGTPGLPRTELWNGVEVARLRTGRRSRARASLAAMVGYVAAAAIRSPFEIRSWRPDVLHAHFAVPAGAAAWMASMLTGFPYLLTVHLGDLPGGVPEKTGGWFRWIHPLTPPIWNRAAAVVAVSRYTQSLAARAYAVATHVIPNGVDLSTRPPPPDRIGQPAHIVFVGRFQPQKNLILLVDVLGRLRPKPWRATLVGDGPMRSQVEDRIRKNGLEERVRLTGWVHPGEADRTLASADILFLPSLSEGLPVVGVQALALGLAIVGSRAGGLDELIVEGVNGYGRRPDDLDGFVQALDACLEDPAALTRMKAASHALAEGYDIETAAGSYEALLTEAARRR